MSGTNYLSPAEVIARYRGQLSEAILYPSSELDRRDKSILVVCRPTRKLPFEKMSSLE
jgi:hypothetical protein